MAPPRRSCVRGRSPPGRKASVLDLERRCGLRLRQVRRADLLLGSYDVMRLAEEEFGLRVSRDVALQWLDLCGAADPSDVPVHMISSLDELDRRVGRFLEAHALPVLGSSTTTKDMARSYFRAVFPRLDVDGALLFSWFYRRYRGKLSVGGLQRFRLRGPSRCVSDCSELVSRCGPLLDLVYGVHPYVSARRLSQCLARCGFRVKEDCRWFKDYVAVRGAGLRANELLTAVPLSSVGACLADRHLHGADNCGMQALAARRGVALSHYAVQSFRVAVTAWPTPVPDGHWQELERLLSRYLVSHGVCRVCEELLALHKVVLPFSQLRELLLARCRPGSPDLGRLPVERCWRVIFACVERLRRLRVLDVLLCWTLSLYVMSV